MHVRSDNYGPVFMHYTPVGSLVDVSEETDISSLGVEECINQPTNYRTKGGVWNESPNYLISKHLIRFVTQNKWRARRAISAIYSILYTVHIGPQRAALPLPLLLSPMDPLPT
jgi:hypothetical protein